jgi:beta-lactamase regulating signal transducer with metallopeptidase domain
MKEKLPSLLASKQGLLVACALFNVLDAKDRKLVVKSIQEPLKEMTTNKVAHLFIVHIINNLDDTVISKKKILNDIILTVDENINDKCFQNIFLGIYAPKSKRFFTLEDVKAFEVFQEHSTSKKDPKVRRDELIRIVTKPLETFYEENMLIHIMDITNNPLFTNVLKARIEIGEFKSSDAMDEMLRQVQKKETIDNQKG